MLTINSVLDAAWKGFKVSGLRAGLLTQDRHFEAESL